MKRNLLGLTLFILIFVVTLIFYQTFLSVPRNAPKTIQAPEISLQSSVNARQKSKIFCNIKQATLDLQTQKLNVELRSCDLNKERSVAKSKVTLTAFLKKPELREIASQTLFVPINFEGNDKINAKFSTSAAWLFETHRIKANSQNNIYLIAQISGSEDQMQPALFSFDEQLATPVLIANRK